MEKESVRIIEIVRIQLCRGGNGDFRKIAFPEILKVGEVDGHTGVDVDYHGNGLLTSETVGKVGVGISGRLCWNLDEFGRVRRYRDGVGVSDAVDELTLGTRARAGGARTRTGAGTVGVGHGAAVLR